jgi:vacuolar-type H+-ATPase catalytic subunit A/Vma1
MTADELYLSNLKKLYPNITEKELDDMFKNFKQEVEKQEVMEEVARLARMIDRI